MKGTRDISISRKKRPKQNSHLQPAEPQLVREKPGAGLNLISTLIGLERKVDNPLVAMAGRAYFQSPLDVAIGGPESEQWSIN